MVRQKFKLTDTTFCKAVGLDYLIENSLPFMIENYAGLVIRPSDYSVLASLRTLSQTPLSDIYSRIVDQDMLRLFLILNLRMYQQIPEVLTFDDLSVDGHSIPKIPSENLRRMWVNITPITSAKQQNIVVDNLPRLHELVGRGSLVMSYNDSDAWLNPRLSAFVIETYSTAVASLLQRLFNLDPNEYLFVQTLFAAYYAQILGSVSDPLDMPPLLNRVQTLGNMNDVKNRLDHIADLRENKGQDILTPEKICNILATKGSVKMKSLKLHNLQRVFSSGATDNQTMMIAFEYPPYWVYQLLKVLSGAKNMVVSNLFKFGKMKLNARMFAEELVRSPQFLNAIGR